MPKTPIRPKYSNQQIVRLIKAWIHDKDDRKMLYLHLVDGETIGEIADRFGLDDKTVWKHLKDGKKEVFSHLPG